MIDGHVPTQRQFLIWLVMYNPAVIEKAIQRAFAKTGRTPPMRPMLQS